MLPYVRRKKGLSLIEAAIVLGVVGAVIGTIWYAAAKFYEDYKVQKYATDVLTINQCVRKKFPRLECDSVLCQAGNSFTNWWAQTKFFDDIGCIPASIEKRGGGYYDYDGSPFAVILTTQGLKVMIGWSSAQSVSVCAKLVNSIIQSAKLDEILSIQIGIIVYQHFHDFTIQDTTRLCEANGTGQFFIFKP